MPLRSSVLIGGVSRHPRNENARATTIVSRTVHLGEARCSTTSHLLDAQTLELGLKLLELLGEFRLLLVAELRRPNLSCKITINDGLRKEYGKGTEQINAEQARTRETESMDGADAYSFRGSM